MSATLSKYQRRVKDGVLPLRAGELEEYYDLQARRLVGLSGCDALARIRSGRAGQDLHWTSLSLMAALFPKKDGNNG